jgi:hypothetical protein
MYGVGQGLERGVGITANMLMNVLQLKQQDAHFQKALAADLAWKRGMTGMDEPEDQTARLAASRPAIPSATPTETPGQLGVPITQFPVGAPVQPVPATAPPPAMPSRAGAAALIPLSMRMATGRRSTY